MKSIIIASIALVTLVFASSNLQAHSPATDTTVLTEKPVTLTFWVGGVCGDCKARIEGALDVKGVRMASYNLDKHECTVVYNPKKISEDQIHTLINKAGHDTSKSKASDEEYGQVNACCKYRTATHNH